MDNIIRLLADMIAIPSVNPMGSGQSGGVYGEKELADYLFQRLSKFGLDVELDQEDEETPCLMARLDQNCEQTLVLDAHLDTVSHLEMSIDPFDPVIKGGKMYGRGSCDTKASMATYIDAIEQILRKGQKLSKNIIIMACADEEFSFGGIRRMVKKGLKADYAIVGEPTGLNGLYSHKGVLRCLVKAKGRSCHSSTPELGSNAIYHICAAVERLKNYQESLSTRKHAILGSPSLSVGVIRGGTTVNTVPSSAEIDIDRRLIPGEQPQQVFDELRQVLADMEDVQLESPYVQAGGYHEQTDHPMTKQLQSCCSRHSHSMAFHSAAYGTHGPFYREMGIPSIVYGPGSIAQAHTKDEFVEIEQVQKSSAILQTLLTC
jgi:acetylornithine deacetylase